MYIFPKHIVAVGGVIENDNHKVLLVKEKRHGWVFPGGQVEVGENLINALKREIYEESGIQISVGKLFWVGSNTSTVEGYNGYENIPTKVIFNFTGKFAGGELRGSDETLEARWIPKEEVLNLIDKKSICDRYQAYLNFTCSVTYMEYITEPDYAVNLVYQI